MSVSYANLDYRPDEALPPLAFFGVPDWLKVVLASIGPSLHRAGRAGPIAGKPSSPSPNPVSCV